MCEWSNKTSKVSVCARLTSLVGQKGLGVAHNKIRRENKEVEVEENEETMSPAPRCGDMIMRERYVLH